MQTLPPQMITEYHWQNIRDEIEPLNPALAEVIDRCQPNGNHVFSLVTQGYGEHLLKDGVINIQSNHDNKHLPRSTAECCGVVLKGAFESFHQFAEHIAPIKCHQAGDIIGLDTHALMTHRYGVPASLQLTAGARSIFMLPKITDSASHKNIMRELNIRSNTPKKLTQHWDIFKDIVQSDLTKTDWHAQVLLLPTNMLDGDNPQFHALQYYLSMQAHQHHEYWRHQYLWDLTFSRIKSSRNLKPNPYLADTCKHLFAIGVGAVPGFSVAEDESLAPIKLIQEVYMNQYGLKHYAPVLMQPTCFQYENSTSPVYYSLQLPTLLEFSPKSRSLSSTISDLREVNHIASTYISELKMTDLGIKKSPIFDYANCADFTFYHSEADSYGEVQLSKQLLTDDALFKQAHAGRGEQGFSENSPFVRGCIRIGTTKMNAA